MVDLIGVLTLIPKVKCRDIRAIIGRTSIRGRNINVIERALLRTIQSEDRTKIVGGLRIGIPRISPCASP